LEGSMEVCCGFSESPIGLCCQSQDALGYTNPIRKLDFLGNGQTLARQFLALGNVVAPEPGFAQQGGEPTLELWKAKLLPVLNRLLEQGDGLCSIALLQIGGALVAQGPGGVQRIWRVLKAALTQRQAHLPLTLRRIDPTSDPCCQALQPGVPERVANSLGL